MASVIGRGLVAGAVGTTLLNAATYVDMLLTGRDASSAPGQTVLETAHAAGLHPPDDDNRVDAYGALGGIAAGLGVGVLASAARRLGVRLPAPIGSAVIGLAAMAATDGPMAATGVSDPTEWSATDWARDFGPHLVYGAGVRWAMDHVTPPDGEDEPSSREPAGAGLVARSLALGMATGCRTSLGLLGPAWSGGGVPAVAITGALAATELTMDKLPNTPSRLELQGLAPRLGTGAIGGAALAASESRSRWLPALAGALGSFAGTILGAAWRDAAADRGWTWQAALVEDAAALGLVTVAVKRG